MLNAQRVALTNQLAPALTAMGLSGSIDLLRATFNADGTNLDRFMDVVKVSTTPTTATITNILDAANTLIINTTTGATTGTLPTTGLAPSGTPIDQIKQNFQAFANFFATSLPNPTDPNLVALLSIDFLDGGQDRSAFLTDITTNMTTIGLKISNLVVDSVDTAAGTAQVHFTPVNAAGVSLAHDVANGTISWQTKKNNISGAWQAAGNQRIADVRVRTRAQQDICTAGSTNCAPQGTPTRSTGLSLEINNLGLQPIGSAVVTGPGLPAQGVTLTAQANVTWFTITNPAPSCQGCTTNIFTMTDNVINGLSPNSSYTVKLFSNAATPILMATYTEVVPVPPVLNTTLANLAFPSITNRQNLAGITNKTLPTDWQIPAGLFGDIVAVFMHQSSPSGQNLQDLNVRADLNTTGTATSGTSTLVITPPATGSWTNGNYWISAFDQHGGGISTFYQ